MVNKLILSRLIAAFALTAQPGNYTGWHDTTTILKWKADSLKFGTPIVGYANDLKALMVMFCDTTLPGFYRDSIKGVYGYQRGLVVVNKVGKVDTTWRNLVIADTFSTLPGDTAGKWLNNKQVTITDHTSSYENWLTGQMDTTYVTGFAVCSTPVIPWYAPLMRAFVKGLSGNATARWITVRLQWQERQYIPVRGQ